MTLAANMKTANTEQSHEPKSSVLPHVSVVIPARDCATLLPDCLAAISSQTYRGSLDVTVALAPGSPDTARVLADTDASLAIQVVDNPSGTTPAALNAAIAASKGDVIVRVDAQARIPPNYIEQAVAILQRTGAANVGGRQRPIAATPQRTQEPANTQSVAAFETATASAIAAALGSSFGAGPAAYRRGSHDGPADTVYLGVFRRDALSDVGGFDETLIRNQDYELNWRLRREGFTVWLDSSLIIDYVSRASFATLSKQFFGYGTWKRVVLLRHPSSLRPRQLAAPALVVGLAASAIALCKRRVVGLLLPAAYLTACTASAAKLKTVLPSPKDRLRAAFAFMVMHMSWGVGFLTGRTKLRKPQRPPSR